MEFGIRRDIDRRGVDRIVPMRCLALGLGRTGTRCEKPPKHSPFTRRQGKLTKFALAVCEALRMLDFYETYHMEVAVGNVTDSKLWLAP